MKRIEFSTTLLATAVLMAGLHARIARAQEQSDLPPQQDTGVFTYRTGGIGKPEAEAMKADARHHPLSLLFTSRIGERDAYAAEVDVIIKNDNGLTLLMTRGGPFLSADLPDGHYRVSARYQGIEQSRDFEVRAGKPIALTFSWKDRDQTESRVVPERSLRMHPSRDGCRHATDCRHPDRMGPPHHGQ